MRNIFYLIICLLFLYSSNSFARKLVAKVTFSRGDVSALFPGRHSAVKIKKGDKLYEDTSILTGKNGIAKIRYVDGASTSIGANSKVVLIKGGAKKSTLVGLLKGKIRSKIGKKAKAVKRKDNFKHMLIIKSRSASIGVRGTDFLTVHNPKNKITSIVSFEGKVAISKIKRNFLVPSLRKKILGRLSHSDYEVILNSDDAEAVRQGRYSGVVPAYEKATVPVKISPVQYTLLKKNENLEFGKNGRVLKNSNVDKLKIYGRDEVGDPPPEGYYDKETGSFAPKSGGYIDISTGIYVQPEADSKYDKKYEVYQLSEQYGGASSLTGDYVAPKGLELTPEKGFQYQDISNDQKVKIATDVFGIDDKDKLAPKVRKKLRKSFDQVLALKKAVLNNELREDILKDDFGEEDFVDQIAKEFQNALKSIHEVLDIDAYLKIVHDTNVVDKFEGEIVKNTKEAGKRTNLGLKVSHNNYLLSNWIIIPKIGLNVESFFLESSKVLNELNSSEVFMGLDNAIEFKPFDKKNELNLNINLIKKSKFKLGHDGYLNPYVVDSEERNESRSLFKRSLKFDIHNDFYFSKWQYFSLGYRYANTDSFSSRLNGKYRSYYSFYSLRFLPRFELIPYFEKWEREALSSSGSAEGKRMRLEFNIYNVFELYTFFSNVFSNSTTYDELSIASSKGEESLKGYGFRVRREVGDSFTVDLSFKNESLESVDNDANYDSNQFGVGLNYSY